MARAALAFLAYLLLAIATTWPLTRGLGEDVPWDLGDPLLVMWILSWDCEQILGILGGDFARIASFFDANIFYPVPLTLAYSEHMIAQAVQILPVYAISGNPILSYNLLFLSTWVLSGLGMYLLVRELTGSEMAAFVAGLMYGFAPYRLPQSGHLHVLSSQWMPFVLFGLRRYFVTRQRRPLAGATLALVLQSLSSGYYLLLFSPIAATFAMWEIGSRHLWRDRRMWRDLTLAGVCATIAIVPFLLPYAALRGQWNAVREISEVMLYSADLYSYATAFGDQRIWGDVLRMFPKPEGELFPGLLPIVLALVGLVVARSTARIIPARSQASRRWLTWLLVAVTAGHAVAAILAVTLRRVTIDAGWFVLRISDADQMLLRSGAAFGLLLIISPGARARVSGFLRDRGFFVICLVAVLWLSLGPEPQAFGRPLRLASPYLLLYDHVPGFDGLRVPARLAMLSVLMLTVLAGFGAAAIARMRGGTAALIVVSGLFLLEATHMPFILNAMPPVRDLVPPEARVYPPQRAPAVYLEMARQAEDSVLLELPLGQPDYDLRAMYYSTIHWRPIVNGYSGFFPARYASLTKTLSEIPRHAEESLEAIRASGATHAIVHEGAYFDGEGQTTTALLRRAGAVELFREGSDVLLDLSLAPFSGLSTTAGLERLMPSLEQSGEAP